MREGDLDGKLYWYPKFLYHALLFDGLKTLDAFLIINLLSIVLSPKIPEQKYKIFRWIRLWSSYATKLEICNKYDANTNYLTEKGIVRFLKQNYKSCTEPYYEKNNTLND